MLRVVVDTNLWLRILMGGATTIRLLELWEHQTFQLVTSETLLHEFNEVVQRPRVARRIDREQARRLYRQIVERAEVVVLTTIPPRCRDPKDQPVLATAIDGRADAIVTGDSDLRADDQLRAEMAAYGVQLWGVQALIDAVHSP